MDDKLNQRDYYEKYKASLYSALYDTVEIFKRKYIMYLLKNDLKQYKKIIDIGSGSGVMPEELLNMNDYFCMDIALSRIQLHSYYTKTKGYPNLSILGDACILPVKDNSLDIVFCIETLEHIKNDKHTLKEINRILKPSGKLLLTVPYDEKLTKESFERIGHVNTYNEKNIKDLAIASGLTIKNIVFISRMLHYCWTVPKHIIYLSWLIFTGRLIKRLNKTRIPSYYNTGVHRKSILPISMFILKAVNALGLAYTKKPYIFCWKAAGMIVILEK
jgi:ubiquinone/menaquinone biosynthesis C-methylase UbiE